MLCYNYLLAKDPYPAIVHSRNLPYVNEDYYLVQIQDHLFPNIEFHLVERV